MSSADSQQYVIIEQQSGLQDFYEQHRDVEWLCFDTEFIGEKRYFTLLCLIQVASPHGYFMIDPLKVKDLRPFFRLIEDPNILIITHAGDNDYRLLHEVGGVVPKNVFDIQLAAGFLGYKYPTSFGKLVGSELGVSLSKSYTVADWEARPLSNKELKYALEDVLYLYPVYEKLMEKLEAVGRASWVAEENKQWEGPAIYENHPYNEALKGRLIGNLRPQQQAFLLRLYTWRDEQARAKNYSKEMVLPHKLVSSIVKGISSGKAALKSSRIIPNKIVARHWDLFNDMYQQPISEEERNFLNQLVFETIDNAEQELLMDMLYFLVKHKCLSEKVSPTLVIQRSMLQKMAADPNYVEESLERGWRRKMLGEELVKWLRVRNDMQFEMKDGKCVLWMEGIG